MIDAYQTGLIGAGGVRTTVRRAREQLQTLHNQIATRTAEENHRQDLQLIVSQVETFRKMLEGSLEQADWPTRRQVITNVNKTD